MDSRVEAFFQSLPGKRVAFLGIGVTNTGIIKLFAQKGAQVTACDKRSKEQLGQIAEELTAIGVTLKLGPDYLQGIEADMIFRTPGMKFFLPELNDYRKHGVAVTSEMEVFFELCPSHKIAVTGSDGKTTTTTVLSEFLKAEGNTVHLGGNIGKALLPDIETMQPEDYAVVELSSFQLISMRQSPDIAVVTNVAPNHLDMHKDMQEYIDAKRNILLHQNAFSKTILNADNEITRSFASDVRGQTVWFSYHHPVEEGSFLDSEGYLCMAHNGEVTRVLHKSEIRIPGEHNVENYLTAIAAAWGLVSPQTMAKVAKEFGGVEHRIEFVREIGGAKWYNDSIASSPTRTIAGLKSFPHRVILIAGGYDKKIPYEPLAPYINEKVHTLILMGATGPKIEKAVKSDPTFSENQLDIRHVSSMEEAVQTAYQLSKEGDIITLSPASASFDLYPNFEVRGRHYKQLVKELPENRGYERGAVEC